MTELRQEVYSAFFLCFFFLGGGGGRDVLAFLARENARGLILRLLWRSGLRAELQRHLDDRVDDDKPLLHVFTGDV